MLSSYINFANRIASGTLSFGQRKINFDVISSCGSSSALIPAMLRVEWFYCVAKILFNGRVTDILTQAGGITET